DARPRVPVGPARERLGRLEGERLPHPVLGQVQLQGHDRRQVMSRIPDRFALAAALLAACLLVTPSAPADSAADHAAALKAAQAKYQDLKEGANADYIPALAKVDSNIFGIALVTTDGKVYTVGDVKSEVSIQSISKVFTMARVIEDEGPAAIEGNM